MCHWRLKFFLRLSNIVIFRTTTHALLFCVTIIFTRYNCVVLYEMSRCSLLIDRCEWLFLSDSSGAEISPVVLCINCFLIPGIWCVCWYVRKYDVLTSVKSWWRVCPALRPRGLYRELGASPSNRADEVDLQAQDRVPRVHILSLCFVG